MVESFAVGKNSQFHVIISNLSSLPKTGNGQLSSIFILEWINDVDLLV